MRYSPEIRRRQHGEATAAQVRAGWVDGPPHADATVRLAESDPQWAERFAAEDRQIRGVLGTAYVGPLTSVGYRLVLREPWWWTHRMLVSSDQSVNPHAFPHDAGAQ